MKHVDDLNAKFKIWAAERRPLPFCQPDIPIKIESRSFSSYEDFNAWKRENLVKIAKARAKEMKWKSL